MVNHATAHRLHLAAAALLLLATGSTAFAARVLMVSVDGMKPEYILEADRHGLKIPFLRSLVRTGAYAEGVVGVWPTVTYPSHTTLITGVSPAEHGIVDNTEFDPLHDRQEPWYWYADQIRAPTLWQAVHGAKRSTASVGWPVTVGAGIDYLIPEFWRISGRFEGNNPSDRYLIAALSRPDGMLTRMQGELGPYMMANDTTLNGDRIKTRYTIAILRERRPAFTTLHLSSLDDSEHAHGPFSAEANADLESIDGMLAELDAAARAIDPATVLVVTSDHGFVPVDHRINLFIPFIEAGLIDAKADPESHVPVVSSWRAQPWFAGGMAAIMLKDPADQATEQQVGALLRRLAADPRNGIASIRDRSDLGATGGFPEAAFIVSFQPGYYAGANLSGELITGMPGGHGGHGFAPEFPEMRAAFFITGRGVAAGRTLGVIDMRQIAPTVAAVLGVPFPSSKAPPLAIRVSDAH